MTIPMYLFYEKLLKDLRGMDDALVEIFKILIERIRTLEEDVAELKK